MTGVRRTLTAEEEAAIKAKIDAIIARMMPKPKPVLPKPKAVTRNGVVVSDADVHVDASDPNAGGVARKVEVRRDDRVTINQAEAERQWAERERDREQLRRQKAADILRLYGPYDDE